LIRNRQKDDPDLHQDDDEKGILDPVPFWCRARASQNDDYGWLYRHPWIQFRAGSELDSERHPEFISGSSSDDSGFRQNDN